MIETALTFLAAVAIAACVRAILPDPPHTRPRFRPGHLADQTRDTWRKRKP